MTGISEKGLFFVVGLTLTFLLLNFNPALGTAYLFFLLFSFVLIIQDSKVSIPLERKTNNRLQSIAVGIGTYYIFILTTQIILGAITGNTFSISEIVKIYAEISTPAFAGSVILTYLSWGILVPIIETKTFFARVYEQITDRFKVSPYKLTAVTITAMAIIVAAFVVFHATSFGVQNNTGFIGAALFGVFSFGLIFIFKETKQAIVFHIYANIVGIQQVFAAVPL